MRSFIQSSRLAALALGAALVAAQDPVVDALPPGMSVRPEIPHADKRFTWPDLPYQVDTDTHLIRGVQSGYNICNSTTEGPESQCQTAHFNSIEDFCIWAPAEPGEEIGTIEGFMVAWCTQPGHGTRLIPEGAMTGLQWLRTPDYVQAVGFFDHTMVNIMPEDYGGEIDPHGADGRGNPMGGLVFSNAWNDDPTQVVQWHLFIGRDRFCFKACDPSRETSRILCDNRLDRIGCDYNVPNMAQDGVFEECLADNQDPPGVYTLDGAVMTYQQPEGPIGEVGFTPRTPVPSACTTYESAALFTALPTGTGAAPAEPTDETEETQTRITTTARRSASESTGRVNPSNTAGAAGAQSTNGASRTAISGAVAFGILASVVFLA